MQTGPEDGPSFAVRARQFRARLNELIDAVPAGPEGLPGEVTEAQLADAVAGTSANSNGVATLDDPVSDPPTQAEVQANRDKLNELILALRRT